MDPKDFLDIEENYDDMVRVVRDRILSNILPESEFEVMLRREAFVSGEMNESLIGEYGGRRYRHLVAIDGGQR